MTIVDEPRALGEPAVAQRSPDPLLAAFAASRAGFDCPAVCWDDDASPDPLLEGALHAGGPEGRVVQLVVLSGRVADARRIEMLLGAAVPGRTLAAAELLVAVLGVADARVGIDLVVDRAGVWWFGGLTVLP
ncbi:hypothetical protein H4J02_12475 [Protaetiibacter sp. SSC-01]|uniref:hypothetical protein n=1 Tax=Protaetiibacter sp. SSC-01 TaxID=2759943 RepID=UPI0016569B57|nr:hypothetical protein [Protaetiibacter sp. SSC-01]QNO37243.1 hypothetical protein H4J02_12475 [Protaetiibacter sp. SSC-01]